MSFDSPDDTIVFPDFRTLLQCLPAPTGKRQFAPLRVGDYILSVQASPDHASTPRAVVPVEDVDEWEVAIFTPAGRWVNPTHDSDVFYDPLWSQCWDTRPGQPAVGTRVPTEVVQVLADMLHEGPENYERYIEYARFMDGHSARSPAFL